VDIAAWLRGPGLECYNEAFQKKGIDAEILPKLISDDLEEISITAVKVVVRTHGRGVQ
jgi:hypothetical protein